MVLGYMEHEPYERKDVRPAEVESIEGFLSAIEQYTADGVLDKVTGTRDSRYELPDGRVVNVWRAGIISEDVRPSQAIAGMIVEELSGDEVLRTNYQHYKDGRMEKGFMASSRVEEKLQSASVEDTLSDIVEKAIEQKKEALESLASEQVEREMGLRAATEVDMRDTEELFRLIEEVREGGKENEATN